MKPSPPGVRFDLAGLAGTAGLAGLWLFYLLRKARMSRRRRSEFFAWAIEETVRRLGRLDSWVNSAAEQHPQDDIEDISPEQLERTFHAKLN